VPDENSFLSYNRYLYANGNPLKYNDPLGHCSTLQNGERDLENDAICWSYVDIIVRHWNDDPDYWNQLFGAQDTWLEHLAPLDDFDKDWMFGQYETYLKSNSFRQAENRRNAERALLPLPGRTYAPNPCDFWDCTSAGLSAASLVTSVAQTGTAACTAVASLICGGATHALTWTDRTLGSASVAYSASQYASGDASDLDIAITSGTTLVSSIPGVGIGADLVSLVWDLADPFVPDEQLWGPRRAY